MPKTRKKAKDDDPLAILAKKVLDFEAPNIRTWKPLEQGLWVAMYGGGYGRQLHLVTKGQPTGNVKGWFDFILGPDGQKVVGEHGHYPYSAYAG